MQARARALGVDRATLYRWVSALLPLSGGIVQGF